MRARVLLPLLVLSGIILLASWPGPVEHWVAVHLGLVRAGPDPYYNFWSGFGSDLAEATLVTGIFAAYHHKNCHVRHCPWLGQPVPGTHFLACPKHHPQHPGKKRGVGVDDIRKAYQRAHGA